MSKVFYQLLITMAEDLIVSCFSTEANNSVAGECQMNLGVKKWTSMSVGTGQLCHVRRLAFYFIISFYLMQHKPLWRSKFSDTEDKKDTDKNRNFENFAYKFKASPEHPIREPLTKTNLRKIGAISDKVWRLTRAYKCSPEVSGGLLLFVSC